MARPSIFRATFSRRPSLSFIVSLSRFLLVQSSLDLAMWNLHQRAHCILEVLERLATFYVFRLLLGFH